MNFLLDIKREITAGKNKYGYQLGVKYYNAFHIDNLLLQLEYNHVRPYVYSHSVPITNYGHNNQSIGHQWGGNFKEFIAIARYHKGRYFADHKITAGTRSLILILLITVLIMVGIFIKIMTKIDL
jgi:hypothetical protein